ncbi:MAG: hypothetical protein U0802_15555 [Candidatus Binatia bacterium]
MPSATANSESAPPQPASTDGASAMRLKSVTSTERLDALGQPMASSGVCAAPPLE